MNGRIYDPILGQFMQPDNYIQTPEDYLGYDRYTYCRGNPFKYVDPTGERYDDSGFWLEMAANTDFDRFVETFNRFFDAYQARCDAMFDAYNARVKASNDEATDDEGSSDSGGGRSGGYAYGGRTDDNDGDDEDSNIEAGAKGKGTATGEDGEQKVDGTKDKKPKQPWLGAAEGELGTNERNSDGTPNNEIKKYHKSSGLGKVDGDSDDRAWCASFLNWICTKLGIECPNNKPYRARNWKNWGTEVEAGFGVIAVSSNYNLDGSGSHVGILVGYTMDNDLILLGGNQSDQVCYKVYPNNDSWIFRYPPGYEIPTNLPVVPTWQNLNGYYYPVDKKTGKKAKKKTGNYTLIKEY